MYHPMQAYKTHGFTSPSIQTIKHSSILLILHRKFIWVQIMSRSSVDFRIDAKTCTVIEAWFL